MQEEEEESVPTVTPGEELGKANELKPGKGTYVAPYRSTDILCVYSFLTGVRRTSPLIDSPDQITKVMAKMASADIMCVGLKSVR